MKVVGLSGGIATGKSLVATRWRREGVAVVDCDEIARLVVKQVTSCGVLCQSTVLIGSKLDKLYKVMQRNFLSTGKPSVQKDSG